MKSLTKGLLLAALCLVLTPNLALAAIGDSDATCDINVAVENIAEWTGDFNDLTLATITDITSWTADANSKLMLWTNADIDITGDAAAQLQLNGNDANNVLATQYKLTFDGDGSTATGVAAPAAWTDYDSFAGESVVHTYADGDVMVWLWCRARIGATGPPPDPGNYMTTQTLTIAWP